MKIDESSTSSVVLVWAKGVAWLIGAFMSNNWYRVLGGAAGCDVYGVEIFAVWDCVTF